MYHVEVRTGADGDTRFIVNHHRAATVHEVQDSLRERLAANLHVDITDEALAALPDPELRNAVLDRRTKPQVVAPADLLTQPQVTMVAGRVVEIVPHVQRVWHGGLGTAFQPEELMGDRQYKDPYVKLTRAWLPWNQGPKERVVELYVHGVWLSTYVLSSKPVEVELFMVPANAPIELRGDDGLTGGRVCVEFVHETQEPPQRDAMHRTAFIRHRYSTNGLPVNVEGEQLVSITVPCAKELPPNFVMRVDDAEVTPFLLDGSLTYQASMRSDGGVIGDGPSVGFVTVSHWTPLIVKSKCVLEVHSQKSAALARQRVLDSLE